MNPLREPHQQAIPRTGKLLERIPPRSEILTVFGFAVFAICSWSVRSFLFRLPSFLLYFDLLDLLAIFGYMMAFALLESLAVTALLILIGALLPGGWFRNGFAYKGFLAILVAGIAAIALQNYVGYGFPALAPLLEGALAAFLVWLGLAVWLQKALRPRQAILRFVEGFTVFSYIYVPLGVIGILLVLIRNLI
jgi:hypothetical protein